MTDTTELAQAIRASVANANGLLGGPISDHEAAWLVSPMSDYVGGTDGFLMHLMLQRNRYIDARSDLGARVAELEAALEPFAIEAGIWEFAGQFADSDNVYVTDDPTEETDIAYFNVGDLRRARAALKGGAA